MQANFIFAYKIEYKMLIRSYFILYEAYKDLIVLASFLKNYFCLVSLLNIISQLNFTMIRAYNRLKKLVLNRITQNQF